MKVIIIGIDGVTFDVIFPSFFSVRNHLGKKVEVSSSSNKNAISLGLASTTWPAHVSRFIIKKREK